MVFLLIENTSSLIIKQETTVYQEPPAMKCLGSRTLYLITAHTSPVRFLRQAVLVKYSWGFRRYVSIIKFRYAKYLKSNDNIHKVDHIFPKTITHRAKSLHSPHNQYNKDNIPTNNSKTVLHIYSHACKSNYLLTNIYI